MGPPTSPTRNDAYAQPATLIRVRDEGNPPGSQISTHELHEPRMEQGVTRRDEVEMGRERRGESVSREDAVVCVRKTRDDCGAALDAIGAQKSLAYYCSYKDATNTGLQVEDLNNGLPFSIQDTETLKSRWNGVVSDDLKPNVWEVPSNLVKLRNPNWAVYMGQVKEGICNTPGSTWMQVSRSASCAIYFSTQMDQIFPPMQTPKLEILFQSSMSSFCPRSFEGGNVHLSHDHFSATYDCSATSSF